MQSPRCRPVLKDCRRSVRNRRAHGTACITAMAFPCRVWLFPVRPGPPRTMPGTAGSECLCHRPCETRHGRGLRSTPPAAGRPRSRQNRGRGRMFWEQRMRFFREVHHLQPEWQLRADQRCPGDLRVYKDVATKFGAIARPQDAPVRKIDQRKVAQRYIKHGTRRGQPKVCI